jgi:hypothetical protein
MPNPTSIFNAITRPVDPPVPDAPNPSGQPAGPLSSLYGNKYEDTFLQFPNNLDSDEENHWVRFDISEIGGAGIKEDESRTTSGSTPREVFSSGSSQEGSSRALRTGRESKSRTQGLGSIMLYAPHTRQENFKLNWAGDKIGQVGAAAKGGISGDNETVQSVIENLGSLTHGVAAKLAGSVLGGNADALVKDTFKSKGVAINPHLEMFFDNVDFRSFTFDFVLAPRNESEAKTIRDIINLFKYSAAPSYESSGQGGVFFRYPNVFGITFFNESQTHKIATSALTGVNVNYSGAGVNSTFYDNYPVETHLNLTFTELEIMHKGKIDEGY